MIQSRLFIKVYSVLALGILLLGVTVYALSVPYVERTSYEMEAKHARQALDGAYNLVDDIQRDLLAYRHHGVEVRKLELRHLTEVAAAFVRDTLSQPLAEGGPDPQRLAQLRERLRKFKYGNNDYFWISDYSARLLSHPDPKLHGSDFSEERDVYGHLIVPPMVEMARREGSGYYSYWWRRLGREVPSEKISYVIDFPEYGLILATGVYLDDVESDVEQLRAEAIERLRRRLREVTVGETGYVYIFNEQRQMVIHPNPNIEGESGADLPNPLTGRPILTELMEAVDNPEGHSYLWDRPSDGGNYVYEKISWLRHHASPGWYIASSVYREELRNHARELGERLLGVGLVALLVALGSAALFVKRLITPIQDLAQIAETITGGDLSARSSIRRNDEIGALATAFNGMVGQLKDHIHNLDVRVAERTAELSEAYEDLQQLDRMKSDFLSSVSHELRTPLTSIRGFAKLIGRDFGRTFEPLTEADPKLAKKAGRIAENLEIIVSESERLTRLINDVLDLAKIESGRVTWQDETLPVEAILRQALQAANGQFEAKPAVRLVTEITPDLPKITVDKDRLIQVIVNLLNNAVKFTDQGTITLIAQAEAGDRISIAVQDTGAGFPPEEAESIFDKFKQAAHGDTLTDKPQGTGLGLSICREILHHYHGEICAESELGKGSRFTLTLPMAGRKSDTPVLDEGVPLAQAAAATVLVVDDDRAVSAYLAQLFQEQGYSVVTAADGEEALVQARRYRPGLITMDLSMPRMDGRTAIERLRADPELGSIPIIVISALPGRERTGADLALGKPVDEERLFKDVRALLGAGRGGASQGEPHEETRGHPCLFIQNHEESMPPPGFCTSVERCTPEEVMPRIRSGFTGMVIIPTALLGRVDIAALQQGSAIHLVILPTGEGV